MRYKKDIQPLTTSLQNVLQLRGVKYSWMKVEFPEMHFTDEQQIGLIAQDVEKVLPEMVHTDANGYKSVDYSRMAPVLIEAMKELGSENNRLAKRLTELEAVVKSLAADNNVSSNKQIHFMLTGGEK